MLALLVMLRQAAQRNALSLALGLRICMLRDMQHLDAPVQLGLR